MSQVTLLAFVSAGVLQCWSLSLHLLISVIANSDFASLYVLLPVSFICIRLKGHRCCQAVRK